MPIDPKMAADIVDFLTLSDQHHAELKAKRGFNDVTIAKLKFRSVGPELKGVPFIEALPDDVKDQLTIKQNILMPYFNAESDVVGIGMHKCFMKESGAQLYIPWPIIEKDSHGIWVIAEGEFKAAASAQLGVPAIAVAGISKFVRGNFAKLSSTLASLKPKATIICFDNEIKDDPRLKNYKPDFTKRYDSQFYAFINGSLIEKEFGKGSSFIATLPLSMAIEGKADIDGCLSIGMTSEDYRKVLTSALTPYEYKKEWRNLPRSHQSFLARRQDKFFYSGPISEKYDAYYFSKKKTKDDGVELETKDLKISNFTIEVVHTTYGDTGTERLIRFRSPYGNSKAVTLTPDVMASRSNFMKFLYEHGDYTYSGPESCLPDIWNYIFMNQSGILITKTDYFGFNEEHNMWVFGDGIYKDGKFHPVDENGICEAGNEGFKILDRVNTEIIPPKLCKEHPGFELAEIFDNLARISSKQFAKKMLAWILGVFIGPEIIAKYGVYPQMFFYGTFASGKSTLAEMAMAMLGSVGAKGHPMDSSSKVGLTRVASRYSVLPAWFEESRNTADGTASKNTLFRSFYDRSTILKGSKRHGEIIASTPKANCIISGEEYPADAATISRCLLMHVDKQKHKKTGSADAFNWLMLNKSMFSYFGHSILLNRGYWWKQVEERIDAYIEGLKEEKKISSRNRMHSAIIAGISSAMLGDDEESVEEVFNEAMAEEGRVAGTQALNVFWQDVYTMVSEQKIRSQFYEVSDYAGAKAVRLNINTLYGAWETIFKSIRREHPIARDAILESVKHEPYYIDYKQMRIGDTRPICLLLKLSETETPPALFNAIMLKDNKLISSPAFGMVTDE